MAVAGERISSSSKGLKLTLLGRANSGKKTVANNLLGYNFYDVKTSTVAVRCEKEFPIYQANDDCSGIDAMQLIDIVADGGRVINVERIKTKVTSFEKENEVFHLMLFVVTKSDIRERTIDEDRIILKMLGSFREAMLERCGVVITHCDQMTAEARKSLKDELKSTAVGSKLVEKTGLGLLSVGFPPLEDREEMPRCKQMVDQDVTDLCNFVFKQQQQQQQVFNVSKNTVKTVSLLFKHCKLL
eukprot:m.239329 g.239329  ORF g.239329 m.239329 type:complete len:243 (+) comp40181_c2_seq14:68-796(+)